MATARRHWFRVEDTATSGPVLYAAKIVELHDFSRALFKLGRTTNLRRRMREFGGPAIPRFICHVDLADLVECERELHRTVPFSRAGGGREFYRCTESDLREWLGVEHG